MGLHRDINLLVPEMRDYIKKAFEKFEEIGFDVLISETLRDDAVQIAYYAQGRKPLSETNELRKKAGIYLLTEKENANIITNCDGVTKKSNHQSRDSSGLGYAIDLVPAKGITNRNLTFDWNAPKEKYIKIAEILKEVSNGRIDSGVYWDKFYDAPHHELKRN